MNKSILSVFFGLLLTFNASAEVLHPTIPNTTVRDYSKPSIVIEDGRIYQTIPGTTVKDYGKPEYRVEENRIIPLVPNTNIQDFSSDSFIIE